MSQEITTKDILMLLPLSVLSFADPITDILTLMEFYSAGHKNWFAVGLIFLVLPCFAFWATYYGTSKGSTIRCMYDTACLCGFHPFTAALQKLEALVICGWKKFWHGEIIVQGSHEYDVLEAAKLSAHFEAVFESAPQFVIQLYVVSVQDEPVSTIQIISLPVSFLSLVWSFKAEDEDETTNTAVKYKILYFVIHFFLLCARLFAITYFVVDFRWLIIAIFILHYIVLRLMHCIWPYKNYVSEDEDSTCEKLLKWYFVFGISWIGYETFDTGDIETETALRHLKIFMLFSYILVVLENIGMILLYCIPFGPPFKNLNSWYSLPVTVCVCLFSVVGVVLRFKFAPIKYDGTVHPQ